MFSGLLVLSQSCICFSHVFNCHTGAPISALFLFRTLTPLLHVSSSFFQSLFIFFSLIIPVVYLHVNELGRGPGLVFCNVFNHKYILFLVHTNADRVPLWSTERSYLFTCFSYLRFMMQYYYTIFNTWPA